MLSKTVGAALATVVCVSCQGQPAGPPESRLWLYVANEGVNSILVFNNAGSAQGNIAPDRIVGGGATTLNVPVGIWLDAASDRLYVANANGHTLSVFDSARTITGDVAPSRSIAGAATTLSSPRGLWLDVGSDRLYTTNFAADSVLVFNSASTTTGNVAPSRTITWTSAGTGPSGPRAIWLDTGSDRLYVANRDGNSIFVFDSASTIAGDVAPSRTIAGASTTFNVPRGLALDAASNRLYVANADGNSILVFDNASTIAGDVAPSRIIAGASTTLNGPLGLWLDAGSDRLYVGNYSGNSIIVFNSAGTITGDVAPSRTISGASTTLNLPGDLWLSSQ